MSGFGFRALGTVLPLVYRWWVFFRGLPLPLLIEGAVGGGCGDFAEGVGSQGEDGREEDAVESLA